jgi:hypothetical protein
MGPHRLCCPPAAHLLLPLCFELSQGSGTSAANLAVLHTVHWKALATRVRGLDLHSSLYAVYICTMLASDATDVPCLQLHDCMHGHSI